MACRRWLAEVRDCLTGVDNVMVSVYVQQNTMAPRSLSRTSRKILLTTGVWSVIAIVLTFFVLYTILLLYVDWPVHKAWSRQGVLPGLSGNSARPKVRLLGKAVVNGDEAPLHFPGQRREGKMVWDPAMFDDPASEAPQCRQGSLFVIIVTSSPDHFEQRAAIRKTWCSVNIHNRVSDWLCLFLIGQTNNTDMNIRIQLESQKFGDVLRGSYQDSYRNLTHKVMHGLAWVSRNCPAQFVLKTDDDCFVNALLFRQFLLHHNTKTTNLYAGNLLMNQNRRKVIRQPNEKWSVSEDDYSPEYYPLYASGIGYALSPDVVYRAVEQSRLLKPIPNEDAYIGIVMDSLGVSPTFSGRFALTSAGLRTCNYMYVFLTHGVEPNMQEELQRKAAAAQTDCRNEEAVTDWF